MADEDLQQELLWWVVALERKHPRGEVPEQVLIEQIKQRLGRHSENYERYVAAGGANPKGACGE